jgi:purine nucleosidase
MRSHSGVAAIFVVIFGHISAPVQAQHSSAPEKAPEKIIIDTDIGGDIDDAFAVALALRSPELKILGFSTVTGDPEARAKLLDRMLGETGHPDLPVAVGLSAPMNPAWGDTVSQRRYGEGGHFARPTHPQAVEFLEEQIRRNPGEITLVCIGALTNIAALIDKDRETFRKLKRIVIMGGSIERGYFDPRSWSAHGPEPEANIVVDIPAAQKVFTAGVPLYVMPLDSTADLQLDEVKRSSLFSRGTPLTDALTLLYHQWALSGAVTPVLFDAMTIAYMINPSLCPVQPMRISVDDKGFTRVESGTPNAQVCLHSDAGKFFRFYMDRLLAQ